MLSLSRCVFLTVVFGSMMARAALAGDCSDILTSGIHNTYQLFNHDNSRAAYQNALCNQSSQIRTGSTSAGGGGSYDGFGLNGNYNKSTVDQLARKNCQSNSTDLSDDDFRTLASMTVDHYAVDAWKDCEQANGKGLFGNVDVNGSDVILTLEWHPVAGVNQTTITMTPQFTNISCDDSPFSAGTILNGTVSTTALCKRQGSAEITFVVNTLGGSRTLKVSAVPAPATRYKYHYLSTTPVGTGPFSMTVPTDVTGGDEPDGRHLTVSFIAPPLATFIPPSQFVPNPASHWSVLDFSARQKTGGGYIRPSVLGSIQGTWKSGDRITATVIVPTNISSAGDWFVTYTLIENPSTYSTTLFGPNILQGAPEP